MANKRKKTQPCQEWNEKEIYARIKREFTAADLQKYTELDKGIPFEMVLSDAEAIHARETRKRKKAP